jgi:6-phosphogluconolactonase (cycloisomerase 2 family)
VRGQQHSIDTEGSIFAMRLDRNRRELTVLNSAPAKGRSTCFLNCDAGRSVLTAVNYWDARLAVVGINPLTGHLAGGPAKQVLQQARGEYVDRCAPGREEHWAYRQRWAHTHCAVTEPYTGSNNNLFVADLGEDKILWFDVSGALVRRGECQLPRGVGPRHLVFHPTLRVAYVVNELNSSVSMLAVDEAALNPETRRGLIQGEGGGPIAEVDDSDDGGSNRSSVTGAEAGSDALTLLQSISTLPADWQGRSAIKNGVWKAASHCSEIKVHPSGKFLFVANRGHDSLAVFAIDQATGTLAAPTFKPSGGMTPRNFSFACGGDFVVVGNQDSNTLALFSFDATSGALTLEDCIDHPSPNYVYTVPRSEAARAA